VRIEKVKLERIALEDRTFDLGFARRYEALRLSVERVGILQPLVVRSGGPDGRLRIVCGFGRASAAKDLRIAELPITVLPSGTTDADCLRLALLDNLGHRDFNPMERAVVLGRLEPHEGREGLLRDYMPLFGLAPEGPLLERILALNRLVPALKTAVAERRIEEKIASRLAGLAAQDQERFADLLHRLPLTVSLAREFAEMLLDIARRDRTGIGRILAAPEIAAAIESDQMKPAEKVRAVRRRLAHLRRPALSEAEERFARVRSALRLPPSARLEHAPYFESDVMRLEIRFRDAEEIRATLALLKSRFDDPSLVEGLWPKCR